MVHAQRLERARDAVPQVKSDEDHARDVDADPQRRGEDLGFCSVQVANRRIADLIPGAELELLEVYADEEECDQARPDHRRGRQALAARVARPCLLLVADRTRAAVAQPHRNGLVDVQQEHAGEPDLDRDDQRIRDQHVRVLVEGLLPGEHEQVAGEVEQQIREKQEAGQSDEQLRADRRGEHPAEGRHRAPMISYDLSG